MAYGWVLITMRCLSHSLLQIPLRIFHCCTKLVCVLFKIHNIRVVVNSGCLIHFRAPYTETGYEWSLSNVIFPPLFWWGKNGGAAVHIDKFNFCPSNQFSTDNIKIRVAYRKQCIALAGLDPHTLLRHHPCSKGQLLQEQSRRKIIKQL